MAAATAVWRGRQQRTHKCSDGPMLGACPGVQPRGPRRLDHNQRKHRCCASLSETRPVISVIAGRGSGHSTCGSSGKANRAFAMMVLKTKRARTPN
jgi:hypothetical protein